LSARSVSRAKKTRQLAVLAAGLLLVTLGVAAWLTGRGRLIAGNAEPHSYLDPPRDLALTETPSPGGGVPVLCYHYFRRSVDPEYLLRVVGAVILNLPTLGAKEFWTIPGGEFERHLRFFRDEDVEVLTLADLADLSARGEPPPSRAVVLPIDDPDLSVYALAFPLLREYGFRAHLFVPTAQVGRHWNGLDICTWDQLREMAASGHLVIDSHTHDLHWKIPTDQGWQPVFLHPDHVPDLETTAGNLARNDPDRLPPLLRRALASPFAAVTADLLTSRQALAIGIGAESRFLAWPYGFASGALDSVAAAVGFAGTVSLRPRAWDTTSSPWHTGRFGITAKTTPDQLAALFTEVAPANGANARSQP